MLKNVGTYLWKRDEHVLFLDDLPTIKHGEFSIAD